MARYLQLAAYSGTGAKAVIEGGFAARRAAVETMLASVGGSVIGYYAVTSGEWHVAALVELPDEVGHADLGRVELMQLASGAVGRLSLLPLALPDEFDDAARQPEEAYRPPGTS